MNNATLAVRVRPDHPNHHLPPSPAASGATAGRDGDGDLSIRILSGNPNHHLPPSPAACGATAGRDGDGDLSIRIPAGKPNHHLWNNNGTWWCHYTIHRADFTKQRVRVSLETCNPREARAKRDALLTIGMCEGRA